MTMMHCGYIAVLGRPNVGKSTLINACVGVPLSIATHKPQTTRHRILGVVTKWPYQYIYLDTPGFHLGEKKALNRYMNRTALATLADVNIVLFVVQALRWGAEEEALLKYVKQAAANTAIAVVAVVTKIDLVPEKDRLLPFVAMLSEKFCFHEVVPISVKKNNGVSLLEQVLAKFLPEQPHLFDADDYTDRSIRFLAAERVREALFLFLQEEIPYATSVEIETFQQRRGRYYISAVIWVEKESQKGIVIGKKGEGLKSIGSRARRSINRLLGQSTHLELWVRVKPGWTGDERVLSRLGYTDLK